MSQELLHKDFADTINLFVSGGYDHILIYRTNAGRTKPFSAAGVNFHDTNSTGPIGL